MTKKWEHSGGTGSELVYCSAKSDFTQIQQVMTQEQVNAINQRIYNLEDQVGTLQRKVDELQADLDYLQHTIVDRIESRVINLERLWAKRFISNSGTNYTN